MAGPGEVLAAAQQLIERFGDAAGEEAATRARELTAEGHDEAGEFWLEVSRLLSSLDDKGASGTAH